ncbi:MAG: hypothetical protein IJ370_07425 [Oscillospiraceae bacterium]|nr:hypothetical protein [Oscillospiraceae bacterium]
MKNLTRVQIISKILVAIGVVCISLSFLGVAISTRDNKNYTEIQDEISVVEPIHSVLFNPEAQIIYVGYDEATCVNAYTQEGEFLWAVSVPRQQNGETRFFLYDEQLIVETMNLGFFYDAKTGAFIEEKPNGIIDYELIESKQKEHQYQTDGYSVYKITDDGSVVDIITRPYWYVIFNPIGIVIGLICFVVGIIFVNLSNKKTAEEDAQIVEISAPIHKRIAYMKITSALNLGYAFINFIVGVQYPEFSLGLIPITLNVIVGGIIMLNDDKCREKATEKEISELDRWKRNMILCAIAPFVSLFITISLFSG